MTDNYFTGSITERYLKDPMNKLIRIVLLGVVLIAFTGCGGGNTTKNSGKDVPKATTPNNG